MSSASSRFVGDSIAQKCNCEVLTTGGEKAAQSCKASGDPIEACSITWWACSRPRGHCLHGESFEYVSNRWRPLRSRERRIVLRAATGPERPARRAASTSKHLFGDQVRRRIRVPRSARRFPGAARALQRRPVPPIIQEDAPQRRSGRLRARGSPPRRRGEDNTLTRSVTYFQG